ncbi:uroporphyrinogen decarboxylase family protein [Bacillota bacterium]
MMTSMERVLSAISHKEPDRVPLMLLLSLYGAKERQMKPKDYFSSPVNIIKTQLFMRHKYRNDCLYTFTYAAAEIEAFGGEVIFYDDGPPNSGEPVIKRYEQIDSLKVPDIKECKSLKNVLEATEGLKKVVGDSVPIIGVVMSPYSLPVMQMGFEKYIELIYSMPEMYRKLMSINTEFCVSWANAQLEAGATAIGYFDPLASPEIIDRNTYIKSGYPVDCSAISRIKGATATHLASGAVLPVLEDIIATKTAMLGVGPKEDIGAIKKAAGKRIALLGNLNGIDMLSWSEADAVKQVKTTIEKAGRGGGLLLSDCHGEIPYQVPEDVLMAISESVSQIGTYPLKLAGDCNG